VSGFVLLKVEIMEEIITDMEAIIKAIQNTQTPKLLIVVGLFILVLAFLTKIGGVIEVSQEQRRWAIPIGGFLLILGLILNPSTPPDHPPDKSSPPKCKIIVSDPNPPINVRESPNGKVLGTLPNGEILKIKATVRSEEGDWFKIDYQGRDGYVFTKLTEKDCD
jgi:uncharacterized protein YgiM (DUF1202 family)